MAAVAMLGGCATEGDGGEGGGDEPVIVFAASSLSDAFGELEVAFEDAHPGRDVQLNFAGSSALREQILAGAPADVFAAANEQTMAEVIDREGVTDQPSIFAHNELIIAVPADNPAGVDDLGDLANEDLLIGLCAEGVPCGDFARSSLARAGIPPAVDTNEPDVRSLLSKVAAGDLDAGIVYRTDIGASGGNVIGVSIPPEHNTLASYPVVRLDGGKSAPSGDDFVDFLLSADGQAILAAHGFMPVS